MRLVRFVSRGRFVVFEGIDGSGKSTLTAATAGLLGRARKGSGSPRFTSVRTLREPTYESQAGKQLRDMLSRSVNADGESWLHLFLEDRKHNVEHNILPAVSGGALILQDRYYYSTAAYQGQEGGKLTPQAIIARNQACGFPEPDLVVFLELSVDEALRRIAVSRPNLESFENRAELVRISANYEAILPEGVLRLNALQQPEELAAAVSARIFSLEPGASPRSV